VRVLTDRGRHVWWSELTVFPEDATDRATNAAYSVRHRSHQTGDFSGKRDVADQDENSRFAPASQNHPHAASESAQGRGG
jgi:hypothetical protein